jgi:clan AA aspartic protease (TIGR02281 family)
MQKYGGVYTTPCLVNGLRLRFIFDTGASNVSLSLSEAIFMLKNGYLDEKDLHGSSYSQIANGDIVENTTVNLKELEIGGIKIYNVDATIIHELSAPLLLGQSAIQKLGKIQIEDDELIIMNSDSPTSVIACLQAKNYASMAEEYFFDKLYALSAETYQKAYDLCPEMIDCFGLYLFGYSYYYNENYLPAIKFFEKSIYCQSDNTALFLAYSNLGRSYSKIKDFDKSVVNLQKALTYASKDMDKSNCYGDLSYTFFAQEKYEESIKYSELDIEHYLKHNAITMNDVMRGKFKNDGLGEKFMNLGLSYYRLKQESKSDNSVIKAALCGYEEAINYCKKYGLKYELYLE